MKKVIDVNIPNSPDCYCTKCNSTNIVKGSIYEWLEIADNKDKLIKKDSFFEFQQRHITREIEGEFNELTDKYLL